MFLLMMIRKVQSLSHRAEVKLARRIGGLEEGADKSKIISSNPRYIQIRCLPISLESVSYTHLTLPTIYAV